VFAAITRERRVAGGCERAVDRVEETAADPEAAGLLGDAQGVDLRRARGEWERVVRAVVPDDERIADMRAAGARNEQQRALLGEPREIGGPARPPGRVVVDQRQVDNRAVMAMQREEEPAQIVDGLDAGLRHGDLLTHGVTLSGEPGRWLRRVP
jgi:hypothetical protein